MEPNTQNPIDLLTACMPRGVSVTIVIVYRPPRSRFAINGYSDYTSSRITRWTVPSSIKAPLGWYGSVNLIGRSNVIRMPSSETSVNANFLKLLTLFEHAIAALGGTENGECDFEYSFLHCKVVCGPRFPKTFELLKRHLAMFMWTSCIL